MKDLFVIISSLFAISTSAQTTHVTFRAFAEGFYRQSTNSMVAVIDPIQYPMICDTVLFAFIDPFSNSPVYCTKAVIGINGYGNIEVPQFLSGQMLIPYVRFRNTLGIYSRNEILIEPDSNSFDLTDINFTTINCNQDFGISKARSGEMYLDGFIDLYDFIPLDNDITNGASGYIVTDLNGDGYVDVNDFPIYDINNLLGASDPYWFTCSFSDIQNLNMHDLNLAIYPNPVTSTLNIEADMSLNEFDLTVYSSYGEIFTCEKILSGNKIIVDVTKLASGVYMLRGLSLNKPCFFVKQ